MSSIGKGQESLRNHRAAGIGILIGYGIVCLLGNFFLVHIAERVEPFNWTIVSMWILGGLVFSQAAILVVWLTLGADSLRRRTFIFVCGTCACFASWLLGYLVNLETN